jgi:hypothetical protein
MEEDKKGVPVREENRYKHTDETQEKVNTRFAPLRIVTWIVAILFILSGVIWLGYAVGLLAAAVPGEPGIFQGWIWGMVGVIGLGLLIYLLTRRN